MAGDHAARDDHEALQQVRGELLGPVAQDAQGDRGHHDEQTRGGPPELPHHPGLGLHCRQPD